MGGPTKNAGRPMRAETNREGESLKGSPLFLGLTS